MSTKTTKLGLPLIPEAEYDTKKVIDMIKENQGTASDSAFNKIDSFASDIDTRVAGKQEKLVSGQNIKTINGKSVLGTGDIEITVPSVPVEDVIVNGSSVVANKIAKITVPTKVSDLANDSKFITNSVDNLVNYYVKADIYTKTEIDNILATFSKLKLTVVDSLPATGEPDTIYLVPADSKTEHNYYNEYIWLSDKWELLGNTKIDLSDYAKTADVDSKLAEKQDTIEDIDAIRESANNALSKDEFKQARTEIEEEIKAIEVEVMKYQFVTDIGDVELTAETLTSYAVTPEAGITSLKISLPAEINIGYQSEVNFRGYYGHGVTINSSLPIYYMQYGLPCSKPELSINAYISFLFNFDGLKLTCYVSEVPYNS